MERKKCMRTLDQIDPKTMREAIADFNSLKLADNIRVVGVSKKDSLESFVNGFQAALDDDDKAAILEKNDQRACVKFWNFLFEDEEEGAEPVADNVDPASNVDPAADNVVPAADPVPAKPEKAAKPKKEPKPRESKKGKMPPGFAGDPNAPKSRYGHYENTQAAKLDDLLFAGGTVDEIATKIDRPHGRVKAFIRYLREDRGLTVQETETKVGEDTVIHYKVLEDKWTKPVKAE
jgi:hypothetical protein